MANEQDQSSHPSPSVFPKGIILPWYATSGPVPNGWAICNGDNHTPDLRNQFLLGVGTQAEVGKTFGSATHNHAFSGTTVKAQGPGSNPDPFKIDDDRGCCPQCTGLDHFHAFSGTTQEGSSIPPSIGVLFIIKL